MVSYRNSSVVWRGLVKKLLMVSVVIVTLSAWAEPAVGETSGQRLPINVQKIDSQTRSGLKVGEILWEEGAGDRFVSFVAHHGSGQIHRIGDGFAHFSIEEPTQKINVALIDLTASRGVEVSPPNRQGVVGSYASEIGAQVAINGNWFAPFDGPAVSNGQVYGGDDHGYTALMGFTHENDVILENHQVVNDSVDPRVVHGVSGHPTLVENSQVQHINPDPTFLDRHPRTIVGTASAGEILMMVTVDGRQPGAVGMTGDESAHLMHRLGAEHALMLDGGGSTTMWVEGLGVVNSPAGPLRVVGNELAAFAG